MFDIVLHEKLLDVGLTRTEAIDMIDALNEEEFLPIEIDSASGQSVAVGFIGISLADQLEYDYKNSGLERFIGGILADVNKESEDHTYDFKGKKVWLTREER